MKIQRNGRLIGITQYLLDHPHTLVSLTHFTDRYQPAESFISEDLAAVKKTFKERRTGILEMIPDAVGGARFIPEISYGEVEQLTMDLCDRLSEQDHLLPGGYVHLSGLLGELGLLRQVDRIIASRYPDKQIDAVMAAATKGVPVVQAVSYYLNVPFMIVRRNSRITEGSTVSMSRVPEPSERIEKMELSERSLERGPKVLVVDDFMKGGDAANGMKSMIEEFGAELVGVTVFTESKFSSRRVIDDYTPPLYVEDVDT